MDSCSALKSTIVELFVPRRPLKPPRKERKKIKTQNLNSNLANIVVRVIRAFNVPIREETLKMQPASLPPNVGRSDEIDYESAEHTFATLNKVCSNHVYH